MNGKLEAGLARVTGDSSAPTGDGSEQLQKAHTCLSPDAGQQNAKRRRKRSPAITGI
jgi:hypothetical protein